MSNIALTKCRCGNDAEFAEEANKAMFARCKACGIRTPARAASVEYCAKAEVAKVWNAGAEEWPEWIQPTGAHDAYTKNAKVSHKSKKWVSTTDANVWEPGVSGWRTA